MSKAPVTFIRFIKRLFVDSDQAAINPPSSATAPAGERVPAPVEARREPTVIIVRDEILDGHSRIAGYRFVPHRVGGGARPDPDSAIAALHADDFVTFAERRLALLPVALEDWQVADFSALIAGNATCLVASPPHGAADDDWRDMLATIKAAGGQIALDSAAASNPAALALADMLVLDFGAYSLRNFEQIVRRLATSHPKLVLAADGVGSWPEHRFCQSMGIRYCLGGFASTQDEDDKGQKLNQNRLVLIDMLNLLRREASFAEISAVAKRDPWVAVKVVILANSPLSGLATPIASLEQAMMVLGREMLYRWLSVSLFRAGSKSGRDESLLELALYRARFLELLAGGLRSKQECDELFLVGLLSLLDSLLGLPMDQIVAKMNLTGAVADVLLKTGGPYAPYLTLALAAAKGQDELVERMASALGIEALKLKQSTREARLWSEEALRAS